MIGNARHVVDKLVAEEQAQRREAQQGSRAEASDMRQQVLLLEQQQSVAGDMHQRLLSECKVYES
eukprot:12887580-Prorocentrum_lima.AAC.1